MNQPKSSSIETLSAEQREALPHARKILGVLEELTERAKKAAETHTGIEKKPGDGSACSIAHLIKNYHDACAAKETSVAAANLCDERKRNGFSRTFENLCREISLCFIEGKPANDAVIGGLSKLLVDLSNEAHLPRTTRIVAESLVAHIQQDLARNFPTVAGKTVGRSFYNG